MYFGTTFYRLKRIKSTPTAKVKEPRGVKLPVLTDRQLAIMEGKASNVRKNELSVLLDKLNRLDMQNELQELLNRYAHFFESEPSAPPKYTPVEAHALLQAMTPWKLPYKKAPQPDLFIQPCGEFRTRHKTFKFMAEFVSAVLTFLSWNFYLKRYTDESLAYVTDLTVL